MGTKKKHESGGGGSMDATNGGSSSSAYAQLSFTDVLEDLSSRFIVNLPAEEQKSIERICFQVEQAHWFYEDFLRPLNPSLPSLALRRFSSYLLHTAALTVPLIQQYIASSSSATGSQEGLEAAFDRFMKYKTRVPVCGAVMLNATLDKCILVKGWKSSAAWGFPKGKINQQETERDCAIREVYEETGFDCTPLLPSDSNDFMELTMREQKIRLYIVPGLDENTQFETQTRKEISKIDWFKLSDLPTWKKNKAPPQGMGGKFYLISPFIGKLKQWIHDNRSRYVHASNGSHAAAYALEDDADESGEKSHDLKALLGLTGPPPHGKGSQMIEEHGDARGKQLLDLLRGAPSADDIVPGPAHVDFGQQTKEDDGTASLLAALNAGSSQNSAEAGPLLALLNGTARSAQNGTPLPAPQAQRKTQAQGLLNLISPSASGASLSAAALQQSHAQADVSSDAINNEAERSQKRDKLLSDLLSGSLHVQDRQQVDHTEQKVRSFVFPPAPPSNAHLAVLNGAPPTVVHQAPASPFSTFVQQHTSGAPPHVPSPAAQGMPHYPQFSAPPPAIHNAASPPAPANTNPLLALLQSTTPATTPGHHSLSPPVNSSSPWQAGGIVPPFSPPSTSYPQPPPLLQAPAPHMVQQMYAPPPLASNPAAIPPPPPTYDPRAQHVQALYGMLSPMSQPGQHFMPPPPLPPPAPYPHHPYSSPPNPPPSQPQNPALHDVMAPLTSLLPTS